MIKSSKEDLENSASFRIINGELYTEQQQTRGLRTTCWFNKMKFVHRIVPRSISFVASLASHVLPIPPPFANFGQTFRALICVATSEEPRWWTLFRLGGLVIRIIGNTINVIHLLQKVFRFLMSMISNFFLLELIKWSLSMHRLIYKIVRNF